MASTLTVSSLTLSNASGASTLLITNRPASGSLLSLRVLNDVVISPNSTLQMSDASSAAAGVSVVASNLFNDHTLTLATNASVVVSNLLRTATKPNQAATLTTAGGNVVARAVKLGEATGSLGTWTILAGTNLIGETLQIGSDTGTGIVNRTGGKLIVGGTASDYGFSIAGSANSTGTVVLAQGQVAPNGPLAIGERGFGRLVVSNGLLQADTVKLGAGGGARGVLEIAGGTNNVTYPIVGLGTSATGEVVVTGGELTTSLLALGGSAGTGAGVGSLVISNGVVNTGQLECAGSPNGVGTVTVAGGKLKVTRATDFYFGVVYLGNQGTGVLWQTGGEIDARNTEDPYGGRIRLVGEIFQGTYSAQLVCSGGVLRASQVEVGHPSPWSWSGSSVWKLAGGTSLVERSVLVLTVGDNLGQLSMSGGRLETPLLQIEGTGSGGVVTVAGGEAQVTRRLDVGSYPDSTGVLNISGGTLRLYSASFPVGVFIGAVGTGQVNVAAGSLLADQIWVGAQAGSAGSLTVSGGLVESGTGSFGTVLTVGESAGSTGVVWYSGGNLRANAITLGEAGYGSMYVGPNADLEPLGILVGRQNGAVGVLDLNGGTLSGLPRRVLWDLEIGMEAGSTGTVWVTDGALHADSGCWPGSSGIIIGGGGSGRLSATNSFVMLISPTVGSQGTLGCVNSQFAADTSGGCPIVNSNVMRFVGSTAVFSGDFQNYGTVTTEGGTLQFYGVDNAGTIIATNGIVEFLGNINNTGNVVLGPDLFRVTSAAASGDDVVIWWQAFDGNRYRVQVSTNSLASFDDFSPEITAAGTGHVLTNYVDVGALTNAVGRVYRVRQVW